MFDTARQLDPQYRPMTGAFEKNSKPELCQIYPVCDFIQGEVTWNFADFQTSEGIFRVNGNKKGVFTRTRQPKESAFILKKRWENK